MEPRIQYCTTSDGVSIAYWTVGEGVPLVHLPPMLPFSHIQREWQNPDFGRWYKRLAERTMLVRYDARGTGMSQREGVSFSLEAFMLDVQAVVDHLGLDRFALLGFLHSGLVAIPYAIQHPEHVSHLVLWCSHGPLTEYASSSGRKALHSLIDQHWEMFTETLAQMRLGWSGGEQAHRIAAYLRESLTQDQAHPIYAAVHELEVMDLLSQMKSPTIVFHRRNLPVVNVSVAMALASGIPNAQLVVLEGASAAPYLDDMDEIARTIEEFLGLEVGDVAEAALPVATGGLVTILFTDIEGSTALTERLGDAKARDVLREHERLVREALKSHGGSEIKTMGDGFMASFGSATKALECAVAIQKAFESPNQQTDKPTNQEEPIQIRIGLNAGEPVAEEGDLFGTAVNMAARIAGQAQGGEILVSDVVRQLVAGKGFVFEDRGEQALKGFEEPVRVYEVRWA